MLAEGQFSPHAGVRMKLEYLKFGPGKDEKAIKVQNVRQERSEAKKIQSEKIKNKKIC